MPWYIVYKARARARDGNLYERIYVRKLRNLIGKRLIGKPKLDKPIYDRITDHYLVNVYYKIRQKYRSGIKHPRMHRFTVVLAQGKGTKIRNLRLTRNPPVGPKIDRK